VKRDAARIFTDICQLAGRGSAPVAVESWHVPTVHGKVTKNRKRKDRGSPVWFRGTRQIGGRMATDYKRVPNFPSFLPRSALVCGRWYSVGLPVGRCMDNGGHHEIRFWSSPRARRFGTAVEVIATMLIQHEDRIVREWPLWEWTCFITAARVTHFYSELLVPSLPELRVTQFYSEQLIHGLATTRVTQFYSEQLIHGLATARVTQFYSEQLIHGLATARVTDLYSEVLYLPRAKSRVTRFYAELLVKINYGGGPGSEGGMFDGTCKIIFQKSSLFDGRAVVVFSLYAYVTQQRAEVGYVGANPTTYITQQRAEVGYVGANPTTYITQQRAEVGYIIRRNKTNTFDGKVTIAS